MNRILVIGGSGYVGSRLIGHLKSSLSDAAVDGIDAGWFADQCDGIGPLPELMYDNFEFKDVRDLGDADIEGYESIVYLCAISNDPMGDRFAQLTDRINNREAVRIAATARRLGTRRFVLASSASVYGRGDADRTESSPLDPQTEYARSKLSAEAELEALAGPDFHVTCLRFATACGWSPRIRLDLVLNDFVASAITTRQIVVLSDGSPWRPLIHVSDMALAMEWAIGADRESLDPYVVVNVGSSEWNFQIRDLAAAVAETLGGVTVSINSDAAPDTRSYRLDFSRWRELAPNHQPRVSLRHAIAELAENLRNLEGLGEDFRKSSRTRLRRLQELTESGFLDSELRWTVGRAG